MKSVKIAAIMLLAMVLPACSDSDEGKGEGDNSLLKSRSLEARV